MTASAVEISGLSHHYGQRQALSSVSFDVPAASIFGLLGPNGGGKTTLFRIAATLLPLQAGRISLCGLDVATQAPAVRSQIGVTFQSPSLDKKLTVSENLWHQGHLYGLSGRDLRQRMERVLDSLGLSDRRHDRAESLSGGLQRRVEIGKGLLHDPRVLLLDEPSTGLDPGARIDLWTVLARLREQQQMTIVVTTHLMDEAERCDRLGILDRGRMIALGSPGELRSRIGGDCITITADSATDLSGRISERFGIVPSVLGRELRIDRPRGHELVRELVEAFPDEFESIVLGRPTLEDVFLKATGHRFWEDEDDEN